MCVLSLLEKKQQNVELSRNGKGSITDIIQTDFCLKNNAAALLNTSNFSGIAVFHTENCMFSEYKIK